MRAPSPWIARFAPLVRAGGAVLDVACGAGRHVRLFLDRGHPVTAIDVDVAGLGDLARHPGLEIVETDLEDGSPWPLESRRFAGVVVCNYLWRPLLPRILDAIDDGGVLLYDTFACGNEAHGRPTNPDFLLQEGELPNLVRGRLRVVAYDHGFQSQPRPAVKQRICAVHGETPAVAPPPGRDGSGRHAGVTSANDR